MTTSQYGGYVAFDPARIAAEGPVDTGIVNDGLIDGAAHAVDEQPQTLVAWLSPTSSQFVTWQYISTSSGAPAFCKAYDAPSLHPRPNGKPPVFVVECLGAFNGNPGTVTFVVGLFGPAERERLVGVPPFAPSAGVNAISFSFSSATPAWATPATVEYDAYHTVDSLRTGFAGAGTIYARRSAGGTPATVDLIQTRIEVWAYASSSTTVPRLYGLVVREFCGSGT